LESVVASCIRLSVAFFSRVEQPLLVAVPFSFSSSLFLHHVGCCCFIG
jgi:hypothetical protein